VIGKIGSNTSKYLTYGEYLVKISPVYPEIICLKRI